MTWRVPQPPRLFDRRNVVTSAGSLAICASWASAAVALPSVSGGPVISITEFGARSQPGFDNTRAVQAAINAVERRGGGTVLVPGRFRCGAIVISGSNVRLQGQSGWLVDARLTIGAQARNIQVADLGILDTSGDRRRYLLEVAGQNCTFTNLQLVKDPIAGGVQMYVRQSASGCRFSGLRLKGSNGIILAGRDHLFEQFALESAMSKSVGADDAFAIKAPDGVTENITIRNGIIRGFGAMVSFGSEIGTSKANGRAGIVRNVTVENVRGDRCTRIAFFKPGALDYDYRNGLVEAITLKDVTLSDPAGEYFRTGIYMLAGRGATIRGVEASGIEISARAVDRGVATTSAVHMYLQGKGAPARIENVRLQVDFVDPYAGAPHSARAPGHPVDFIAQIEKQNPASGTMSGVVLDVNGRGSSFGGIHVGPGLDGAVYVRSAVMTGVATDPPAATGGGGIWSYSRLRLGTIQIESVKLPKFGGPAFAKSRN